MNAPRDPLDRAIRAALADVVATAPRRGDVPDRGDDGKVTAGVRRRILVGAATALTAAAGIIAVVAVTTRTTVTTDVARSSLAATTTAAPLTTDPAASTTSTSTPSTTSPRATSTTAAAPGPLQRVEFRRGTNNTSVDAELVPGTTDRYVLEAGSDQRMVVNVASEISDISFSIITPDGSALAADEVVAAVELPMDGDYVVEVSTSGAGGPYTIDFLIN